MQQLQQGAALPAISDASPRMIMDNVTSASAEAVVAVSSDQAGKFATALLRIFQQPRYICYGSVYFAGRNTLIVLRLEQGGRIAAVWERSSLVSRLTEELKDLSFL